MKKILLTVAAVTTALFLMSCDQPSSDSKNENDGFNKPSLPENVGEDPFKGNTYASMYDKWVFSDDGKITQYDFDDDEWSAKAELEYTYNEDTGFISARANKKRMYISANNFVLLTYDEALAQYNKTLAFEEAEIVKELNKEYGELYTYKTSLDDGKLICETYFPENTSLEYVTFNSEGNTDTSIYGDDKISIRLSVDENITFFDITDFSSSQIKAKEEDGDKVITLSYTKEWEDGAFTLKVRAADAATVAIIRKTEIEFRSYNRTYYLEDVNTRQ